MKAYFEGVINKTRQHLKNPGAVFGMLYPYVLTVGLAIGIYYVQNLENISRQSVPPIVADTTIVTDIAVKNALNVPPIDIMVVKNSTQDLLTEGEKLYQTNCASCHGENGAGGGPASMGLNPAPRNFTSKDNWKNGTKLTQIYTTLQEGLLPSAMASYDYFLPEQKFALAHYIRTNFIPNSDADSDADLQALDATYNLSAGLTLAAQIPVKSATFLVISENEKSISKIKSTLFAIDDYRNESGFNVFWSVVSDRKTALTFLTKNSGWKQNKNLFVNIIVDNVNQNGFSGAVFNLKNDEWNSLYSLMLKLI